MAPCNVSQNNASSLELPDNYSALGSTEEGRFSEILLVTAVIMVEAFQRAFVRMLVLLNVVADYD